MDNEQNTPPMPEGWDPVNGLFPKWKQLPLGLMKEYRVRFDVFEGPLDLLLHLVRKQEVDIYQVNLTRIAGEFVAYIDQMRQLDLEVAGDFLVMAATLLYIKSRELLPEDKQVVVDESDEEEEDPRRELIRRLVEYRKYKDAAAQLQVRETEMDSIYEHRPAGFELPEALPARKEAVSIFDLVNAVSTILKRFQSRPGIEQIDADPYTVSEKIEYLRDFIRSRTSCRFTELFEAARSRVEVVVTFLALLELTRLRQVVLVQADDFGDIEITQAPEPTDGPPLSSTSMTGDATQGELLPPEPSPVTKPDPIEPEGDSPS